MLGQSKGSQSVLHCVQSRASLPANIGQVQTDHDAFRANMDEASTSEERTINYLNPHVSSRLAGPTPPVKLCLHKQLD